MITLAILPVAFMSFFTGVPGPVVFGTIAIVKIMYWIQGSHVILPVDPRTSGHYPNETWFL